MRTDTIAGPHPEDRHQPGAGPPGDPGGREVLGPAPGGVAERLGDQVGDVLRPFLSRQKCSALTRQETAIPAVTVSASSGALSSRSPASGNATVRSNRRRCRRLRTLSAGVVITRRFMRHISVESWSRTALAYLANGAASASTGLDQSH